MNAAEVSVISPDWLAPPGVRSAFTLRAGGVSAPPYDSLNLGADVGDFPEAVDENRRRLRETLGLLWEPVWLQQVHGIDVVDLGDIASAGAGPAAVCDGVTARSYSAGTPPIGDAAVARGAGLVCAIRVADCMPVLFAARDGSAVAAAHAGWRGLAGGVLEAVVRRLGLPGEQLMAWMGPAIGPAHFEVGDDVRAAFNETDCSAASAFVANARGRWQCDLYELARRRLTAMGISGIYGGGWCTFAEQERFFSYRRSGTCGRMAALIWIEPLSQRWRV